MQQKRVAGVLGPTNTGKTHYAIERMLAHRSGVIGLPLRLLAREVYDKIVSLRGPSMVALVTGEERIIPPRVQYWVCTVEAMPHNIGADFIAIDEIQLCSDPERGHVFTDRLLNQRGRYETLFLGSNNIRGPISALVPEANFINRERLSTLTYTGSKKVSRMPARSAIVGFSANSVYAMAEFIRRQKGGAAVVLGALSPRTRNAQVALYQNGDVDYLVATDAIGMGLNLDVHHVAFSALSKFDGRRLRPLAPNELAQIAGRAGRGTVNGSFGVTGEISSLDENIANSIVNHRFTPIRKLQWRNSDLSFLSIKALLASLAKPADHEVFVNAREADDFIALKALSEDSDICSMVTNIHSIKLLWDVCRIPDFRGIGSSDHISLLGSIFNHVHKNGTIPDSWFARQVNSLDKIDGDIDTLSKRLAFIRTWTYVSQSGKWLEDEDYWRETTRNIEDRLSDALHQALTQRFVDRRTSILIRRLKQKEALLAEVNDNGEVTIAGQFVGRLDGFRFVKDKNAKGKEAHTLKIAALQALLPHMTLQADRFYNSPDTEIDFTEQGGLMWGKQAVGKLIEGGSILKPGVICFVDDTTSADIKQKVQRRLQHFIDRRISALFEPLFLLQKDENLTGIARGLGFQLIEAMGIIPRPKIADEVRSLDQLSRGLLRKHGVRFGQFTIFIPKLLKPAPTRLRIVLWSLARKLKDFPASPPPGLVTVPSQSDAPIGFETVAGFRKANARAIRVDMLERLADLIRDKDTRSGFEATAEMLSITGMTLDDFADLMQGLGYSAERQQRERTKAVYDNLNEKEDEAEEPSSGLILSNCRKPSGKKILQSKRPFKAETPADIEIGSKDDTNNMEKDLTDDDTNKEFYFIFKWIVRKATHKLPEKRNKQASGIRKRKHAKKNNASSESKLTNGNLHSHKFKNVEKIDPDNPFAMALMALKKKD